MRYFENHLTNIATAIRERAVDRTLIVIVAGCGRSEEKDEEEELLSVGEEEAEGDEDGDVVELAELVELAVAVVVALSVEDAVDDIVAEAEEDELGVAEKVAVDDA